jgi:glycosyltransferase involved in cell wall biosynthesis
MTKLTKKVLLDSLPGWRLHSLYSTFFLHPPEGYKFYTRGTLQGKARSFIQKMDIEYGNKLRKTALFYKISRFLVPPLFQVGLEVFRGHTENEYDLIFSPQRLVFSEFPWVVDLEHVGALISYGNLLAYRSMIHKVLSRTWCKKILPWTEMSRRSLISFLPSKLISNKIEVVPLAIPVLHPPRKKTNNDELKVLFIGSNNPPNIRDAFLVKGGLEVLRVAKRVANVNKKITFIMRSKVPNFAKEIIKKLPNVRLIEQELSTIELKSLYEHSDIFLFPGYWTPGLAFLEAMSFQLPIVTLDVWANHEMVIDGENGFLVPTRQNCVGEYFIPRSDPQFFQELMESDVKQVESLVQKVLYLASDKQLRCKMGIKGYEIVTSGKFSLSERNRRLKFIFDEATS